MHRPFCCNSLTDDLVVPKATLHTECWIWQGCSQIHAQYKQSYSWNCQVSTDPELFQKTHHPPEKTHPPHQNTYHPPQRPVVFIKSHPLLKNQPFFSSKDPPSSPQDPHIQHWAGHSNSQGILQQHSLLGWQVIKKKLWKQGRTIILDHTHPIDQNQLNDQKWYTCYTLCT